MARWPKMRFVQPICCGRHKVTIYDAARLAAEAVEKLSPYGVSAGVVEKIGAKGGEGASGIVWLATEAPHDLTGKFVKDRKVIPW